MHLCLFLNSQFSFFSLVYKKQKATNSKRGEPASPTSINPTRLSRLMQKPEINPTARRGRLFEDCELGGEARTFV